MSKLFVMVGCPGSGKSTWAKNHMDEGDIYISRDEIRYSMLEEGDDYFAHEGKVYREFIKQINEALAKDCSVIVDQTSIDRAARAKLLRQICPKPQEIVAIWINPTIETILKQNNYRTGRECVPEYAIKQMYARMEKPSFDEGFTDVYIIEPEHNWTTHEHR